MRKLMMSNNRKKSYFSLMDLGADAISSPFTIENNIIKCPVVNHKYNNISLKSGKPHTFKPNTKYKITVNVLKNTIEANNGEVQQIPYLTIDAYESSNTLFNKSYGSSASYAVNLTTLGYIGIITDEVQTRGDFNVCTTSLINIGIKTYFSKTGGEFWFTIDFEEVT